MKIAILGTRGIPNNYGGFEQFAQYLAEGLVKGGHDVTVYNSSTHPYPHGEWQGVRIRRIYDPESRIGTAGQFVYDILCILDSRKTDFDIVYQLGYTSSAPFLRLHASSALVVANMDGLEWKRSKYSAAVQKYLKWAESRAVRNSDYLVADSPAIQAYLRDQYGAESVYIPYGAEPFKDPDEQRLKEVDVSACQYNMLIARMEPENSIEIILDGAMKAGNRMPFLVIGNCDSRYGRYLKSRYSDHSFIRFLGGIYDFELLNNLRYFSNLYFHGHTVGGTNPSLLEAMAASALICAHDNDFNRAILDDNGYYFISAEDVARLMLEVTRSDNRDAIEVNVQVIGDRFNWDSIIGEYETYFKSLLDQDK